MKTFLRIGLAIMVLTVGSRAALITNGGFESGLAGWRSLWTRDAQAGTLVLDSTTVHSGRQSARIESRRERLEFRAGHTRTGAGGRGL